MRTRVKTRMAAMIPDVFDKARLFVIDVPEIFKLQLVQVVLSHDARDWPVPMNDRA